MKPLILLVFLFTFNCLVSQEKYSGRSEYDALALADSVYSKLIAGADFKKMASTYSEDPGSKLKGGIYPDVTPGTFVPEFENVVVQLKINEISTPFKTQYGYHIAQVLSRSGERFTVRHILIRFKD